MSINLSKIHVSNHTYKHTGGITSGGMQHGGNLGGSIPHRVDCDGGGSNGVWADHGSVGGPRECGRIMGTINVDDFDMAGG